jgi:hypothetical protein
MKLELWKLGEIKDSADKGVASLLFTFVTKENRIRIILIVYENTDFDKA